MDISCMAFKIAFHGAELKAFFMSRFKIPIFCFGLFDFRILKRVWTASVVDRPFRNPYCLSLMQLLLSRNVRSRLSIIFSRSLPGQLSIHRGLYDDGSSKGLSPFLSRTSRASFHGFGKCPSAMHLF